MIKTDKFLTKLFAKREPYAIIIIILTVCLIIPSGKKIFAEEKIVVFKFENRTVRIAQNAENNYDSELF